VKHILGLVLAGGESRRFGTDKALAEVDGRPLIAHAIGSLAPHADTIVLCGRPYGGAPYIPDRPTAGLGPLGGLNAGLHHALAHGHSHVLSIACDTPFIPATALGLLARQEGPCAISDHPVIGLWPASLGPALDRFLRDNDRRSMRAWMRQCHADELAVEGIANINRPEDLRAYLAAKGLPGA
jgi:molybdopterin-guanine dinucleotide biosynthesis protein A